MNEDKKIEGTFRLEGMLEGPLPAEENPEQKLREWKETADSINLNFDLQIEGGSFNLLAEGDSIVVRELPDNNPVHQVKTLLEQLLELLPDRSPSSIYSTLRGIEYRDGHSVQTVFRIRPGNQVDTMERTVEEETTSPEHVSWSGSRIIQAGAAGLLTVIIALFVLSFFFDFGDVITKGLRNLTPLSTDQIAIQNDTFDAYFRVEKDEITTEGVLVLTLTRNRQLPSVSSAPDAEEPSTTVTRNQLIQRRLRTGYVRVEMFDRNDAFITHQMVRIKPLRKNDELTVRLVLPNQPRPRTIEFTY